jgi:hypothetical protein
VVQEISLFKQLPGGTIRWYDSAGGTPLETGNSFTTTIVAPPHFMLKLVLVNLQGERFVATVNPLPTITFTATVVCNSGTLLEKQ